MKRRAVLILTGILAILPLAASANELMFAKGKLTQLVRAGEVREAETLLLDHAFDGWTLGQTLLTTVTSTPSERERDAFRLAQLLVAKGADVDASDHEGKTALMEACRKRFEAVAMLLLDAGASLRLADNEGRTARDYADLGQGDNATILWALGAARAERSRLAAKTSKITNLRAAKRGKYVVVTFDLEATAPVPVKLLSSYDDGHSFDMEARAVRGHVGSDVEPGVNREILWDIGHDFPDGVGQHQLMLDVIVSQN